MSLNSHYNHNKITIMKLEINTKTINTRFLSVKECSEILGISYNNLLLMVKCGDIPGFQFNPRSYRIKESDLANYIESKRVQVAQL